jgi:hypothetical protein
LSQPSAPSRDREGAPLDACSRRTHFPPSSVQNREGRVIFKFEFLSVELDGSRFLLETTKHRLKTRELAHEFGKSMMRDGLFRERKANTCIIKDQSGKTLGEVRLNAEA